MSRFERMIPLPEQVDALGAVLSNLDEMLMADCERAEALVWAWEGMRASGMEVRHGRDGETRLDAEHDSPVPKGDAHNQSREV